MVSVTDLGHGVPVCGGFIPDRFSDARTLLSAFILHLATL